MYKLYKCLHVLETKVLKCGCNMTGFPINLLMQRNISINWTNKQELHVHIIDW